MTSWKSLNSHQKLSLGVFIVIGLSTIVLGFFRINKAIELPFRRTGTFTFKTSEQLEKERMQKLRELDTDTDGLHDYDELYVFRTSPFLEDSDSDGLNDGAEVAAESDPNCPKGKICRQVRITSPSTTGDTTSSGGTGGTTTPTPTAPTDTTATTDPNSAEAKVMAVITEYFGDTNQLTPQKIKDGISALSAAELRTFLGKLGVPPAALQKADDATLRQLVSETLNEIAVEEPAGSTNAPAGQGATNASQ